MKNYSHLYVYLLQKFEYTKISQVCFTTVCHTHNHYIIYNLTTDAMKEFSRKHAINTYNSAAFLINDLIMIMFVVIKLKEKGLAINFDRA